MRYTMADLSAFSLFFMQSPSFLAHQRRLEEGQGRSNCQTLFGLTANFARKSRSDFGLRRASRPDAPLAHRPPSPATTEMAPGSETGGDARVLLLDAA